MPLEAWDDTSPVEQVPPAWSGDEIFVDFVESYIFPHFYTFLTAFVSSTQVSERSQ